MTSHARVRAYPDRRLFTAHEDLSLPPSERWAYLVPDDRWPDPMNALHTGPGFSEEQRDQFREHWRYGNAPIPCQFPSGAHRDCFLSPGFDEKPSKVHLSGTQFASFLVMECDDRDSWGRGREFPAVANLLGLRYVEESSIVMDQHVQLDGTVEMVPRMDDSGVPVVHVSEVGRTQLVWFLANPVRFFDDDGAPTKSYLFLQRIRDTLIPVLGADAQFTHGLSRNPLYRGAPYVWHKMHDRPWELPELAEATEELGHPVPKPWEVTWSSTSFHGSITELPTRYREQDGSEPESRNTWAYYRLTELTIARQESGQVITMAWLDVTLRQLNTEVIGPQSSKGAMPEADIRSITASVMRRHERAVRAGRLGASSGGSIYTPAQRRAGGRKRAAQESFKEARTKGTKNGWDKSIAASARVRGEQRMSNIERAAARAIEGATRRQIAEHLGVNPETVKKYLREARAQGLLSGG